MRGYSNDQSLYLHLQHYTLIHEDEIRRFMRAVLLRVAVFAFAVMFAAGIGSVPEDATGSGGPIQSTAGSTR